MVTGAAAGIGRATALRLAADGCGVLVVDVDPRGADVAAEIVQAGGRALYVATDVADAAAVAAAAAAGSSALGTVDVLVAAAAVLGEQNTVAGVPAAEWERVLAINLTGVLYCCQAVLPGMVEQGWGRIVVISSHARYGVAERVAYGVSKAGVASLVGALGHGYARDGVLANCIDPGRVLTDMIIPRYDQEYLDHPPGVAIGRFAQPAEIAEVIAFLCSERNTYAVGALWEATGGLQMA